jgi:HlyD family secretion protein
MSRNIRWLMFLLVSVLAAGGGYYCWKEESVSRLPDGIVEANGRIEADQVELATKMAGRLSGVFISEGEFVHTGDVVARMDDAQIVAQIHIAEAEVKLAEQAKIEANAVIGQRKSELTLASKEYKRAASLNLAGAFPTEGVDQRRSQLEVANTALASAVASLEQANAAVSATEAKVAEAKSVLDDTVIRAPRTGRIEYLLARSGEVVGAGGRVATLLDLSDVYMTVFLPARSAGTLAIGADARLILDPIPQYTIPVSVSFVSPEAQFTPKSVETSDERADLMFRVKLQIAPELLKQYQRQVKTGVRGVAYVRMRKDVAWPENLAIKLP